MVKIEPNREQCEKASRQAILLAREELEQRGLTWDELTPRLQKLIDARRVETFLGRVSTSKIDRKTKKRTVSAEKSSILYSKPLAALDIRLKALVETFKLRGDYPPEKKEITGPDGGPIPISKLVVEFVKPGDIKAGG